MPNDVTVEELFESYDNIAEELLRGGTYGPGCRQSDREMAEQVCQLRGWEDFDLFEDHGIDKIGEDEPDAVKTAGAYIAKLRWRVFSTAYDRGIGVQEFSKDAAEHSHKIYTRLMASLQGKRPS